MTFGQALLYFLREATVNLVRSWRVSLVAIVTIAMSLYMSGVVFLVTQNLGRAAARWSSELKVVIYLTEDHGDVSSLLARAREPSWVIEVAEVSAGDAANRFATTFPSLAALLAQAEEEPLPASIEVRIAAADRDLDEMTAWIERLRAHPQTDMVDDDRDWLRQLSAVIAVVRGVGLILGVTLLGAAVFTIASVVKLTAYLYLDEIAVMRLVGATEFFIRGPFYSAGLLQGLLGGAVALSALYLSRALVQPAEGAIWLPLLLGSFLSWPEQLLLVLVGALAGLVGAIVSLRRETLKPEAAE